MNEATIKKNLKRRLFYQTTDLVVDELPLCGHSARADIALVGDTICGYEIKSESDNLSRLPKQIGFYDRVFEFSSLVVAERHFRSASKIVPKQWGLIIVPTDMTQELEFRREARANAGLCAESILEFLWMNELIGIALEQGITGIRKSWGRQKLRKHLAANLPVSDVLLSTSQKMKSRQNWRAA